MNSEQLEFPLSSPSPDMLSFLFKVLHINDEEMSHAKLKKMSGGITNTVFMLDSPSKKAIIRVFGRNTEKIINREEEQRNIEKVKLIDIYATLTNGIICSYQEGRTIDVPMMADPLISHKVAQVIAKMHKVTFYELGHVNCIFDRIQNFIDKIDPEYIHKGEKLDIDSLQHKLDTLKEKLEVEMSTSPIVLCHNDLLSGNILWNGSEIGLVDYEYSGYTWPEFDIANHFVEWCGFELDLFRFPNIEKQRQFIKTYLAQLFGEEPDEDILEQWVTRVGLLIPLSHLFWGSWGFFQASNSTVQFPYFEYAKWRVALMDIQLPLPDGHQLLENQLVYMS